MSYVQIWHPSMRLTFNKYLVTFICPKNVHKEQIRDGNLFTALDTKYWQLFFYCDSN